MELSLVLKRTSAEWRIQLRLLLSRALKWSPDGEFMVIPFVTESPRPLSPLIMVFRFTKAALKVYEKEYSLLSSLIVF